jgi:hypothetical protein
VVARKFMEDKNEFPVEVIESSIDKNPPKWECWMSPWSLCGIARGVLDNKSHLFWNWTGAGKYKTRAEELAMAHGDNFKNEPPCPDGYCAETGYPWK